MKGFVILVVAALLFASCARPAAPAEEKKDGEGDVAGESSEAKETNASAVSMTIEAQKRAALQVRPAELTQVKEYLQVSGTIQRISNRIAHVRPIASGRLIHVSVDVGDRVEKDQVLADFDNIEAGEVLFQYQSAQSELQRLKTQLALAVQQADRNRRLAEIGAASQKELELSQAEPKSLQSNIDAQQGVINGLMAKLRRFGISPNASSASSDTSILSPLTGVITKINATSGETVGTESELFEISDLSEVWVQAEVFEKDLGRVQIGQTAVVNVDTYPGHQFSGKITYVGDILDPQTRSGKVRCVVSNDDRKLKLDMLATVSLPTKSVRSGLTVPNDALQRIDGKPVLFIQTEDTKFEVRSVKTGVSANGLVEITGGLRKGESVVTSGAFRLKSIVLGKELGEGDEEK